jgi:hypothetical protein
MAERSELSVGQEVRVFDRNRGSAAGTSFIGHVEKIGRKLVTINYPGGRERVFRIEDQHTNDGYGNQWFKTLGQVELENRKLRALETLRQHGLGPLGWGETKTTLGVLEAAAHAAQLWAQYEAHRAHEGL